MARRLTPAERIARMRERGWTQRQIAEAIGRSPSYVSRVQRGLTPGRLVDEPLRALARRRPPGPGVRISEPIVPAPRRRRRTGELAKVRQPRRAPAAAPHLPPGEEILVFGPLPPRGPRTRGVTVGFRGLVRVSADLRRRSLQVAFPADEAREFIEAIHADDAQAAGELLWARYFDVGRGPRARAMRGAVEFTPGDFEVEVTER